MDKDYLVEIKSYWQTCWQLLHTSLHSLSTFFSFMMEKRKDNPQSFCHCFPLLGFGSLLVSFKFWTLPNSVWQAFTAVRLQLFIRLNPTLWTKTVFCSTLPFSAQSPISCLSVEGSQPMLIHSNKITYGCERITFCLPFLPKIFYSSCLPPPPFFSCGWHPQSFQSIFWKMQKLRCFRAWGWQNHTTAL